LNDLQLIAARVANIESPRAWDGTRIRDYLDSSIAKSLLGLCEVIDGETYVPRA
jgi:hypothetical protein